MMGGLITHALTCGGSDAQLVQKTVNITENGTYTYDPADDNADGYNGVTVNVDVAGGGGSPNLIDYILEKGTELTRMGVPYVGSNGWNVGLYIVPHMWVGCGGQASVAREGGVVKKVYFGATTSYIEKLFFCYVLFNGDTPVFARYDEDKVSVDGDSRLEIPFFSSAESIEDKEMISVPTSTTQFAGATLTSISDVTITNNDVQFKAAFTVENTQTNYNYDSSVFPPVLVNTTTTSNSTSPSRTVQLEWDTAISARKIYYKLSANEYKELLEEYHKDVIRMYYTTQGYIIKG